MTASGLRELLAGEELIPREIEVLRLASEGYTGMEAAKEMILGVETVREYRKRAVAKLDARNITHATSMAIRQGII